MKSTLAKQDNGTIILTIPLPSEKVKKTWEEVVVAAVKNTELPGFRKGMAPREMVEKSLDRVKVQDEVLRTLLPVAYTEAITEHKLKPVMSPRIRITKIDEGKDWEFTAETCEAPEVKLTGYKEAIKKVTAKSKIVVPGKKESTEPNMDEIMKTLLDTAKVTVPEILVETEAERLLAQMLDEVKSLGISLDQYLASTHKTVEQVRDDYKAKATQDLKVEFVLQTVAEEEKITVEKKELDEALEKAQTPEERKNLEANIYLLASILRQQKTLDYLKSL